MIGVGKGASHLNLNSGTCKTCGTGKTDDCLNLIGGACENPAMLNSANCSNLLSCASHLSYSSQGVRSTLHSHLPLLITHYSSPITNRRAQPFIRRGTLHGVWMSRVILQGTAAMLILNFAPIIIGGKMI